MKKLLCINNGYPTKRHPKYVSYIQTIVNCLRCSGMEVDLYVIRYNREITPIYKALKCIRFWIKALYIDLKGYDIIYINHLPFVWPILLNPTIKGKKVYVHWHGNDLVSNTFFIRNILKFIRKKGKGFKHIVPSRYFKGKLNTIMGYSNDDIIISPSGGVDIEKFQPKQKIDESKFVIGYSAALMKSKGADILAELINKKAYIENICNKSISFKFINYGPEAEFYVNRYKEATSYVNIIEKLPKEKMPEFYQSIDVLLLPSVREGESLGLVVLEAMSCGIPVITHNICAFPEFVIPGESGELVDFSDDFNERVEGYVTALVNVINNYEMYDPVKIIHSNYSEEQVIEGYKTIFKSI